MEISMCESQDKIDEDKENNFLIQSNNPRKYSKSTTIHAFFGLFIGLIISFGFYNFFSIFYSKTEVDKRTFLVFSDLHYNPNYNSSLGVHCQCSNDYQSGNLPECPVVGINSELGQIGCDPPMLLIEKTLSFAKAVDSNPSFIVILGDVVRHFYDKRYFELKKSQNNIKEEILQAIKEIKLKIKTYWPNTPIIYSIGNNDVFEDYFQSEFFDEYLKFLNSIWKTELKHFSKNTNNEDNSTETFLKGGYYSIKYSSFMIIVLNTNLIAFYNSRISCNSTDPSGMFSWLEMKLNEAEKNKLKVWILGHIPFGIDYYNFKLSIKECFEELYMNITKPYIKKGTITIQLFGHEHRNLFRGVNENQILYLQSSVTPIYGNHPGFGKWSFNSITGDLLDYSMYYMDLKNRFPSYQLLFSSLNAEYDIKTPTDLNGLKTFVDNLENNWNASGLFGRYWNKSSNNGQTLICSEFDFHCVQKEICALRYLSMENFLACVNNIVGTITKPE